ncbi:hypothetical protein [Paenibacillus massiliensis]|uniref:hypothetical protein n=1 Tax=Paenibacillus massiliensis TaxID=225917 RepID=UPI00046F9A23|nr:hypothetical protein [Paenibacillus massiliensis]
MSNKQATTLNGMKKKETLALSSNSKRNIRYSLDAKIVQYDMTTTWINHLQPVGLELDVYYNYGFEDKIAYFSAFIVSDRGSYSDGWYLYKHVFVEAMILKYHYEERQGKMTTVYTSKW